MEIVNKKLSEIKPYEKNPRKNDDAVKYVANSIREFGFKVPVVIDKDGVIVCGHTRYKAAKQLGLKEVPCVMADDLSPEQIKAYRIADNKVSEFAEWDSDLLSLELDDITDIDMGLFGVGAEDNKPSGDDAEPEEDDYDEPVPVEAKSKRGDIYQLGQHRLMCGDSTSKEDVDLLMNGEKADLFITDPPYNVAIGDKYKALNIAGRGGCIQENIEGDTFKSDEKVGEKLWLPAFNNAANVSADKCACYVSMPQGGAHMMMMMMMMNASWQVKHELIWEKNMAVFSMGRLDYDYKHEPILYGWNKGGHNFYAEDNMTSIIKQDPLDIDNMTKEQMQKLLKRLVSDDRNTSIIKENKPQKSDLHPTMKPVKLWGRLIKNSTKAGDRVLDLFGGSGTTAVACEQLGRRAFLMEIDPRYVDVIIDRWQTLTGEPAIKIRDGETGQAVIDQAAQRQQEIEELPFN